VGVNPSRRTGCTWNEFTHTVVSGDGRGSQTSPGQGRKLIVRSGSKTSGFLSEAYGEGTGGGGAAKDGERRDMGG